MKLSMYTIFDQKANAYTQPFFQQNHETAKRLFSNSVNTTDHFISKSPEDFTLFYIGEFDDNNAQFSPENPVALGNALQFKHSDQPAIQIPEYDGEN